MRMPRWSWAGLLAGGLSSACAEPCVDDGFGQGAKDKNCSPFGNSIDTTTATQGTETETGGALTETSVPTGSHSGTDTEGTASADATDTESSTWCRDVDLDGFGDPGDCELATAQPMGMVSNDGDCDDDDKHTFPGAAPNDDPNACMRDTDGDDWGETAPAPKVYPGTDCDDADDHTFPGAAPNDDPNACMRDADGDGWGDANGSGIDRGGSDCRDDRAELSPDTLRISTLNGSSLYQLSEGPTPTFDLLLDLERPDGTPSDIDFRSATIRSNGGILGHGTNGTGASGLHRVAYEATCGQASVQPVGSSSPFELCGMQRGSDGKLYGVDPNGALLRELDELTGAVVGTAMPIQDPGGEPIFVMDCALALDCRGGQLLLANNFDHTIYSLELDPVAGVATATPMRELTGLPSWTGVGLEWRPSDGFALLSTGTAIYAVDLETNDAPVLLASSGMTISNLEYLPVCQ